MHTDLHIPTFIKPKSRRGVTKTPPSNVATLAGSVQFKSVNGKYYAKTDGERACVQVDNRRIYLSDLGGWVNLGILEYQ
jgi:hypothetical protein